MQLVRRRHSVTSLQVHLIFTTKYRRKVLREDHIEVIVQALRAACEKADCELVEANGERDHIHALVKYPPKLAVSVLVNNLKAVSSRMVRQYDPALRRIGKTSALWSRSYFACSVGGAPIAVLRKYIENQRGDSSPT